MKPCAENRERLAGLALDTLEAGPARDLRQHLETCAGCRRYFEEISSVTQTLAAAELKPDLEASESFHKQWVGRLRAEAPDSVWEKVVGSFRAGLPTRRVAWPVLGAVAVVSAALLLDWWRREVAAPRQPGTQRVEAAGQKDLPPTIANYQMVARQSAEKLDELLTRQGTRARLPVPVYTAATLPSADALD